MRAEPSLIRLVPLSKRPRRVPFPLPPREDRARRQGSMNQEEGPP